MKFGQLMWYYKRKTFIKVFYKKVAFQPSAKYIFIFEQGNLQLLIQYAIFPLLKHYPLSNKF